MAVPCPKFDWSGEGTRMSRGLVSIIIPMWNRAVCICSAIHSVTAQTYPHWEAIVVDDGSTDDTARVLAERYGSDRRGRYVHQENAGASAARNRGIVTAQGDYVAFLDSDDAWEPEAGTSPLDRALTRSPLEALGLGGSRYSECPRRTGV